MVVLIPVLTGGEAEVHSTASLSTNSSQCFMLEENACPSIHCQEEKSMSGFKASKGRPTLLFGGNAAGDWKHTPLLVHHSENPRALKGVVKSSIFLTSKSNLKAWMTRAIF